ncbi:MAG: hypothetical protein FJW64_02460 [Actinobacteria bacterium]|nr:hypothetical protein [Actinomycetota bacterium]
MSDLLRFATSSLAFPEPTTARPQISLPLVGVDGPVEWTVRRFPDDVVIASGVAPASESGTATIVLEPRAWAPGYVRVEAASGSRQAAVPLIVQTPPAADGFFGGVTLFPHSDDSDQVAQRKETPNDLIPVMGALGMGALLDTLPWSIIETTRGEYAFSQWTDQIVELCQKHGLRLTLRCMQNNPLYNGGDSSQKGLTRLPGTDEEVTGFTNFVLAALRRYPGKVHAVELWNEVNSASFNSGWWPDADARTILPLLRAAHTAIADEFPDVQVLTPGAVGTGVQTAGEFWKQFIEEGGLEHCDAISAHPYEQSPRQFRALMKALNKKMIAVNGAVHPVAFTEAGWSRVVPDPTGGNGAWVRTLHAQAMALVHLLVGAQEFANVSSAFWYNMVDSWWDDPGGTENNFGLFVLRGNASDADRPKPVAWAFARLRRELAGVAFHSVRSFDDGGRHVDVFRFTGGGRTRLVAWTTPDQIDPYPDELRSARAGDGAVSLPVSAVVADGERITGMRDIYGDALVVDGAVTLSFTPAYIDVVKAT